jgi:hypothetical protein
MRLKTSRRAMCAAILGLFFTFTLPVLSRASDSVLPGYTLMETLPGTIFAGVPFVGVPFGTFDFGGGPVNVGNTDMIIRRLDTANAPDEIVPIELVALHLMSAVPADFGCGVGTYFITLQSERGGPASTGNMLVDFDLEPAPGNLHGSYGSLLNVFFDVRLGGLAGPICLSNTLTLTEGDAPWTHEPQPGAVLIDGINDKLNGQDRLSDFHLFGNFNGQFPAGDRYFGRETLVQNVPEPGSLALFAAGGLGIVGFARRRKNSA